MNDAYLGRTVASSRAAATHWRTATTPAGRGGEGQRGGGGAELIAAALPVISPMPVSGRAARRPTAGGAGRGCPRSEKVMAAGCTETIHTQNAWMSSYTL